MKISEILKKGEKSLVQDKEKGFLRDLFLVNVGQYSVINLKKLQNGRFA